MPGDHALARHSPIQRPVFINVPTALKVAFYAAVSTMLLIVAWLASLRVRNYERGRPDDRRTTRKNAKRRFDDFRAGVWMQTLLRDPAAGVMHSCIYFGFIVLFIVDGDQRDRPPAARTRCKFLHGHTYEAYSAGADLAGVMFLIGIGWAIVRRYVQRPYRIRIKTKPEDAVILGTFLVIGVTGFFTEGRAHRARSAGPRSRSGRSSATRSSNLVDTWSPHTLSDTHRWLWGVHVVAFLAFLAILPDHEAAPHVHVADEHVPAGPRPAQGRDEADAEPHGDRARVVRRGEDRGLHVEAAVRHRRVHGLRALHVGVPRARDRQAARPARDRVEGRRGDGRDRRSPVVSPPVGVDRDITVGADSVFERISPEEIWACTSCKACDEICPVNIEILDKILDMRRYLTLMESDFPAELGNTYRSMENSGNAYGLNQGERGDWAEHARRRRDRRGRRRRSTTSTSTSSAARAASTTATRRRAARSRSCCSAPASTSRSSARASCATATRPAAPATSTSSRCSRCRTSRRSTRWA